MYSLFIDESGDHNMRHVDQFKHRFLCLTGVLVHRTHEIEVIKPQIEALKTRHLGPAHTAVLHRADIINSTNGFEPLLETSVRDVFNRDLLQLMDQWAYTVWSVCIDKKAHRDRYKVWHHHPYHYCLEVLTEKVANYLAKRGKESDVIVESRDKKPDKKLKSCYRKVCLRGNTYADADTYRAAFTNFELKIKPKKANIAGLQLADMLAHPSRMEILAENNITKDDGTPVTLAPFACEVTTILASKYAQWKGKVYGRKFI